MATIVASLEKIKGATNIICNCASILYYRGYKVGDVLRCPKCQTEFYKESEHQLRLHKQGDTRYGKKRRR